MSAYDWAINLLLGIVLAAATIRIVFQIAAWVARHKESRVLEGENYEDLLEAHAELHDNIDTDLDDLVVQINENVEVVNENADTLDGHEEKIEDIYEILDELFIAVDVLSEKYNDLVGYGEFLETPQIPVDLDKTIAELEFESSKERLQKALEERKAAGRNVVQDYSKPGAFQ